MKKIYIAIAVFGIGVIALGVLSFLQVKKYKGIIDEQSNQIVIQGAAWQVLLANFAPEQQTAFTNAVNEALKPK